MLELMTEKFRSSIFAGVQRSDKRREYCIISTSLKPLVEQTFAWQKPTMF